MKVLVIGSDGQLGLEFQKISNSYNSLSWVFSTIKTLDLLKLDTISSFLNNIKPFLVILNHEILINHTFVYFYYFYLS